MAVVAELKGKLDGYQTAAGARLIDAEDPLTASIFESIEVMDRELGLGRVLREATGDVFSPKELAEARFYYWMRDVSAFGDLTEPDLVITVGNTLFLLEAKYRSGLGTARANSPKQLEREYSGGMRLTDNCKLSLFHLVCVVGDASILDDIAHFQQDTGHPVGCLQWQQIHRIMAEIVELPRIESRDRILATRCKELLERRRMASFRGFRHLQAYSQAKGFYEEVFNFANMLLGRLSDKQIVRAVYEFRIEKDGGKRPLAVGGLDQWAPSYFALPVQRSDDQSVEVRQQARGRSRMYRVERFAFFMVDVDASKVIVGRVAAKPGTEKSATFWDIFFRSFKKSWSPEMEVIKVGSTEFGVELTVLEPDAPDLLDTVAGAITEYLS
jgi:hypothetical protein